MHLGSVVTGFWVYDSQITNKTNNRFKYEGKRKSRRYLESSFRTNNVSPLILDPESRLTYDPSGSNRDTATVLPE